MNKDKLKAIMQEAEVLMQLPAPRSIHNASYLLHAKIVPFIESAKRVKRSGITKSEREELDRVVLAVTKRFKEQSNNYFYGSEWLNNTLIISAAVAICVAVVVVVAEAM